MRLAPGDGPRDAENRQIECFDQAAGAGEQRAAARHGERGNHPARIKRQSSGDLRAIESFEAGGDIRQQRGGDEIAADHAGAAGEEGEDGEFDEHRRNQRASRNAQCSQSTQQRQSLFERQTEGGVDDEETDQKCEQAEGGEIEMKAVGQTREIAVLFGLDDPQLVARDRMKRRRIDPRIRRDDQTRQTCRPVKRFLRYADIDNDGARRRFRQRNKRR